MPLIINIAIGIVTLMGLALTGYYALFRKSSLVREITALKEAYVYKKEYGDDKKFTMYLAARRLDWWLILATDVAGISMLVSVVQTILQWYAALNESMGVTEVLQLVERPGFLFYAQFAFLAYVTMSMAIVDHTIRSFRSIMPK